MEGGYPPLILPAGYLGSTFFGAAFLLAGFDTLMAKVMSFIAAIGLLAPLAQVRDKMYVDKYISRGYKYSSDDPALFYSLSFMRHY